MRRPLRPTASLFALLCASSSWTACQTVPSDPPPEPNPMVNSVATPKVTPPVAAAESKPTEAKPPDPRIKQRELELARLEVDSAELDAQSRLRNAEASVTRAKRELDLARQALAVFQDIDQPAQLETAQITHDRSAYGADEARDELGELEAMYQAEEFAKSTKELVLKRGRRRLEIAERELTVGKQRLIQLKDHGLKKQKVELDGKVEDAEVAAERAELDLRKTKLDTEVARRRARGKVDDLEKELAELAAKKANG